MQLKKIIFYLTGALLFALPWQTRLLYRPAMLNGGFWEYGSMSLYGTELLLGTILVLVLIQFFGNKALLQKIKAKEYFQSQKKVLFIGFAVFLFFGLQIVFSTSRYISYDWVLHLLEAVCLAFVIIVQRQYFLLLVSSLWLGGVVQGIMALDQFILQIVEANKWFGVAYHSAQQLGDYVIEVGQGDLAERWLRAYGSFGSPNILGGFLALCWLLGIILYLELLKKEKYKVALWVTIGNLCVLVGLIVSFSRSAWLGAAVGVVALWWAYAPMYKQPIIKQLFFSLAVVLIFVLALRPLFIARATGEGRLETKSLTERSSQYSQATRIINRHALWGVGPGTYTLALYQNNSKLAVWNYQPVHNVFVLAFAETGVIGLVIILLFFGFFAFGLWRARSPYISIVATILIISFFDHYWWSLYSGTILCGAAMGICLLRVPKNQPV